MVILTNGLYCKIQYKFPLSVILVSWEKKDPQSSDEISERISSVYCSIVFEKFKIQTVVLIYKCSNQYLF